AYPKLEASFELAGVTGNPFDDTENDIRVTFRGPGGETSTVPAFFDGGHTWRVRYTPRRPGAYTLTQVTLNGADSRPQSVKRRWDEIVAAAEQSGIYLQIVLQHHGQYSSRVDSNWDINPWNAKNGGFLATPEEFFTNPRARALTRAKYRYILARWGYSPHILAWELFNEVQWTDAIRNQHADTVAAWHREMAAFLRQQDPNRHLITTSSDTKIPGLY